MKIGCWEVPKPTDPSLLWQAEWKVPAPLLLTAIIKQVPVSLVLFYDTLMKAIFSNPPINICFLHTPKKKSWKADQKVGLDKKYPFFLVKKSCGMLGYPLPSPPLLKKSGKWYLKRPLKEKARIKKDIFGHLWWRGVVRKCLPGFFGTFCVQIYIDWNVQ